MRAHKLLFVSAIFAELIAGIAGASAQSRSLPRGSALAATPPIDRRNKQFNALTKARQRAYLQQGYNPSKHPY